MKLFAIKHKTVNHYLEKKRWDWSNDLNEETVYEAHEIVKRILKLEGSDKMTMHNIAADVSIVEVERGGYREIP